MLRKDRHLYKVDPGELSVDHQGGRCQLRPPENKPNRAVPPENTIAIITDHDDHDAAAREATVSLKGQRKRDWFVPHAYHCVPIVIGNELGFVIKALYGFTATWNGGKAPKDVTVDIDADAQQDGRAKSQRVEPHFGMGLVTIKNCWDYRAPPGTNLIVMPPPNHPKDGAVSMTAMVEADNLRRDFTLNIRLTRPGQPVRYEAGEPLAALLPYPRGFLDPWRVEMGRELFPNEVIEEERDTKFLFGVERMHVDIRNPGCNGKRYMKGEDIYGNRFPDHQTRLKD